MTGVLWVALGGAIGASLRYLAMGAIGRLHVLGDFPLGTLSVNVLGSLLLGVTAGMGAKLMLTHDLRLLIAVGLLGGFTTFSTFALDIVTLMQEGAPGQGAAYIALSVALSVLAVFGGLWLARL